MADDARTGQIGARCDRFSEDAPAGGLQRVCVDQHHEGFCKEGRRVPGVSPRNSTIELPARWDGVERVMGIEPTLVAWEDADQRSLCGKTLGYSDIYSALTIIPTYLSRLNQSAKRAVNNYPPKAKTQVERVARIELAREPWEGSRLPLHHTRLWATLYRRRRHIQYHIRQPL